MRSKRKRFNPVTTSMYVYVICYIFRMAELIIIRTDQTVFGEAFVHNVIGIVILALALYIVNFRWRDIGIQSAGAWRGILLGAVLGAGTFAAAYRVEYMIMDAQGYAPKLEFFVSAFSLGGYVAGATTVVSVLMCLGFNVINVWMEEGLFRGLFTRLLNERYTYLAANVIASLLFGLWHLAMPLRSFLDGDMTSGAALMSGLGYVFITFLMGFKYGMLARLSGNLWAPMVEHCINNSIVNLLHITSEAGLDKLQFVRLSTAQTISFIIVLVLYLRMPAAGRRRSR